MGTTIAVDGRSIAPIRRKIHDMKLRSDNLTAAWNALIDWFAEQERLQFGSRGARWRTIWPELTPDSLRQKRYEGYETDVLVRTSDLLRSLADRPLKVEQMLPHSFQAGTNLRYARFHQDGTRYMPARPLISAQQIRKEGAASAAVISWIVSGRATVDTRRLRR